jgi:hypothetical protein
VFESDRGGSEIFDLYAVPTAGGAGVTLAGMGIIVWGGWRA